MINNFEVYKQIEWLSEVEIVEKISDFLSSNKTIMDKIIYESENKNFKDQKIQSSDLTDINALSLCTLGFLYDINDPNEKVEELIITIRNIQNKVKIMLNNKN